MINDSHTQSGPPSEAWLFAQAILGRPIPRLAGPSMRTTPGRLERPDRPLSVGPDGLCNVEAVDADARRDREILEWTATISTRAEDELRALELKEHEQRDSWRRAEQYAAGLLVDASELRQARRAREQPDHSRISEIVEWNPNQPRHPKGTPQGGQWAPQGGGGSGKALRAPGGLAGSADNIPANPADPSRWYLPSDAKGEWLGAKGNSTFRLKSPVDVNGKLLTDIDFTNGVPVLDKFALQGNAATIILTGDHDTDLLHAERAWRNLNPGMQLPANATFHHDLLHATEHTVTIDGKPTKVLVGKMQLVPRDVNRAEFHEGSASVARKYYNGLGVDVSAVAELAKNEARLAGKPKTIVSRALGKIKPGKIAKGIAPLVGRSVVRAIPIVGTGLAIIEFADNVEAHGVGGAIARATPVLGDLIAASDLGSDLAKQIRDNADAAADRAQRLINEPSRKAWEQADAQTVAAFGELAPKIRVTNAPSSGEGSSRVDPHKIAAALHEYRQAMQHANYKRNVGLNGFDFDAAAAHNKRQLRDRLERASQERGPDENRPRA